MPDFKFKLLSVSKLLTDHNLLAFFLPTHCMIQDPSTKKVLAVAHSVDGLYKLSPAGTNNLSLNKDLAILPSAAASASFRSTTCNVPSFDVLHA